MDNRLDSLTSWHAEWTGLRVGVLGLGVTGFSVADTLAELGADVLVVASRAEDARAGLLDVIGARLVRSDLDAPPVELLAHRPEVLVVSPGFSPGHPLLEWAAGAGIPV
ncbi:MAG: UDP-N-acetylmuramoyl-L-alanine--D-glutamate ligase, partial [Mycetocola sp.]|nr:UDP-N-acetylmuramoyl-L-alanine--D-glutamate ligase [Mycetocola sp.]